MRGNNILGLIFSNLHDNTIPELTDNRTLGSVPFGGKYRLVDFPVSNMANSGINKIGVVIKSNYHSLMDHLGSGKAWGLSRRRGGLILLPPYINSSNVYGNRVETLYSLKGFLSDADEDYVLLSDCGEVCNIDYHDMLTQHIKTGADITLAYKNTVIPKNLNNSLELIMNNDGRITDMLINSGNTLPCNIGLNHLLIGRKLLLDLVSHCMSRNMLNFKRDILQCNVSKLKIYGYCFNGFDALINDIPDYFKANMALMSESVRRDLFNLERPIYTKIRDDMPSKYGLGASVNNSLIAQGCIIDGEVENSLIFKGVKIGKNTKISNCVIMQDTVIGDDCNLNYVICDKDSTINNNRTISGFSTYPVCITKGSIV